MSNHRLWRPGTYRARLMMVAGVVGLMCGTTAYMYSAHLLGYYLAIIFGAVAVSGVVVSLSLNRLYDRSREVWP